MNLTEKAAYLKGLAEGVGLDENAKETKIINAILDLLDDVALTVSDIDDEVSFISDRIDDIDEDLEDLEEFVYEDFDYDDDDYDFFDDDDEDVFEIECPNCKKIVYIDECDIDGDEEVKCPECGIVFDEFEFEED
ncbi:MAG: hypothetical protein FWF08_05370 [Oscillospiraceae bacterium]|nr:hypothetical protein [Oscillospiraceae bacterium]